MSKFVLTAPDGAARRATIIEAPEKVEARLKGLHPDLTPALLHDAIIGGLGRRNEATRASAPTAPGVQEWMKTVEDLRTLLAARHWHIHQQQNCPFISSPDRMISIVVMTGNSETGKNGSEDPANQAKKGAVAEKYVQRNNQLELFNLGSFEVARRKQGEVQVWALLYHYDKRQNEVRYELSLPTGFDKKIITEWGERIILGRILNDPNDFPVHRDHPNAPVSVEVEPKAGAFE